MVSLTNDLKAASPRTAAGAHQEHSQRLRHHKPSRRAVNHLVTRIRITREDPLFGESSDQVPSCSAIDVENPTLL
jgi:hypothetical protein